MVKTLNNSDISGARKNVKDIEVVGNGDMFQLLCKASSKTEGWMKSTKALETPMGCVVQVTTYQLQCYDTYYSVTFSNGYATQAELRTGNNVPTAGLSRRLAKDGRR